MIRFWNKQFLKKNDMEIMIAADCIKLGKNTWDEGKDYFKHNLCNDVVTVQLLPVVDEKHETVCYAYQDSEANRELRMLKELEKNRDTLQFQDLYPDVRDVIVCGCNELAYHFVRYLESQSVNVQVTGKYWDALGYENTEMIDVNDEDKLVVYAEGTMSQNGDLYQKVIRSVSPEFECIDRIYEANVLEGRIQDAAGSFEQVVEQLKGKEIVMLGTDASAQDAYDLLYQHGIDISCFAEQGTGNTGRTLLGKKVVGIEEAICNGENQIFINAAEQNSALGTETVDLLDYYEFDRNEQLFLIRDYVDIECSNLIHVMKGKTVRLAGDEKLCAILADYLKEIEQGDVDVSCIELSQCAMMKETDILCVVDLWLWWGGEVSVVTNPKMWTFHEALSAQGIVSYTDYFSHARAFVHIDLYRNREREKYTIEQLTPKGILLGRIPVASGNVFFRGIIDGHPNVLIWEYTSLNDNLFLYCIRLAEEKSEAILAAFKKLCDEELSFRINKEFACREKFEESLSRMLSLKERFTSQELFVIFYMAWAEMLGGQNIVDLRQKVIYWEPHHCPREEFPFLAKWLESDRINGQTIFMHRDNLVRYGSCCKYGFEKPMSGDDMAATGEDLCRYWNEFHVRFEDVKLHPKTELTKICDRLEISWSDTMMRTTQNGEAQDWLGVCDFDIKPVFDQYEEYLSAFDRFRISLISGPYQKRYGYTYEDCMRFSRRELQEMFTKEFRFQNNRQSEQQKSSQAYSILYRSLQKQLWEARRHMLMDDIKPEFGAVTIGEVKDGSAPSGDKQKTGLRNQEELEKLVQFIRQQKKLVLYGIGMDCGHILEHLSDTERSGLLFSDSKATYMELSFHGKRVLAPKALCEDYRDYKILITSSGYYKTIQSDLEDLGIDPNRITCNTFQFWEEKK